MFTERKKMLKTPSSAVDTGGKIMKAGVEVIQNTDSVDHWDFLEKIEAPMWVDLSICDLTNDEIDESWFETSHQFHQCSSSQLLSTIFHPNSITMQEPPSPKLPPSVSKSRGKNYKPKSWGQRNNPTSNKQHPVKTLTIKSSRSLISSNIRKSSSSEAPKVSSSCESGHPDTSKPKISKSSLCSLSSNEQKQEGSDLLSSLRNHLRRSCATRPAARMVVNGGGRCSEGFKSCSSKSSVGSDSNQGINVTRVFQPLRNKSKVSNVTNAPAQKVYNKQGSNNTLGKVLMPRKVNQQYEMIDKEAEKRSMRKTESVKNPNPTIQKAISSDKEARSVGVHVPKVTQKNGSKKLIGVKEKADTRNRDRDTTRKIYFR